MSEKSVDARLDDRASSFGDGGEKLVELLKLGCLLRRDSGPLGLGMHLGVVPEGEHEVALDLALVGLAPTEHVVLAASLSPTWHSVSVHPVFEDGEVLDALGSGPHEGLADVAESSGLRELPRLVAAKRLDDDLDDGVHRLIDGSASRIFDSGDHRVLDLFCFCHDRLQ